TWEIKEPQAIALGGVRTVRTRMVAGTVNIVGTDSEPRLEVSAIRGRPVQVQLSNDGDLFIGYDDIEDQAGLLRWIRKFGRRHEADISLAVPRNCSVELGAVNSTLMLSGLRAGADVQNVSGEITLTGLAGTVSVRNVSGSVEAAGVDGDLRVEVISGSLTLADLTGDEVDAQTVSGSILVDVANPKVQRIRAHSTSGSLTVRVPHEADLRVKLHSMSGTLRADLPEANGSNWQLPGVRVLDAQLGAGIGRLAADTVSGSITLLRRDAEDSA
ncbi:MAG: DUF4097 domain-containing protein, partial [Sporichthyaceae bacterium]|nr:DUF4097 domain-containing protein [Sporichthyaceae bacterium]